MRKGTIQNRLKKIEARYEMTTRGQRKYICFIDETSQAPADPKGYLVRRRSGHDVRHFATRAELDAFAARPDVELQIIRFVDEPHTSE